MKNRKWREDASLFAQQKPQTLAIQGPGVIVSIWPDWVILLYVMGVEVTVE